MEVKIKIYFNNQVEGWVYFCGNETFDQKYNLVNFYKILKFFHVARRTTVHSELIFKFQSLYNCTYTTEYTTLIKIVKKS